jgi:hypothetical protein
MTEEEARLENTSPGASQLDEKPESQKSLIDKSRDLLTGTLRFQQTTEQRTMTDAAKTPKSSPIPKKPEDAQTEFVKIKQVLIGPTPEWCLPRVNEKAKASSPTINDSALTHGCEPDFPGGVE